MDSYSSIVHPVYANRAFFAYYLGFPSEAGANPVLSGTQGLGVLQLQTISPVPLRPSRDRQHSRAAEIVGIHRDNHHIWLKKDPEYAAAFEIAWKRGADALEAEAVRRAFEGVTKPIFHGGKHAIDVVQNPDGSIKRDKEGKPVGIPAAVREYSDVLLIFLLKGRNPAVFGDRIK